jgi:exopolysaccharide biosynthesis polyprenyl glycosylphosphotransferase
LIYALIQQLVEHPVKAYQIVGVLNNDIRYPESQFKGIPVFNGRLKEVVKEHRVNTLIFSLHPSFHKTEIQEALELRSEGVKVCDALTFYKHLTGYIPIFYVNDAWLLFSSSISNFGRSAHYKKIKRLMDIALSLLGLIYTFPVLLISAIAIKLDSEGPIFYVAKRVGLNDKEFKLYKFRTMAPNSDVIKGPVWTLGATAPTGYAQIQSGQNDSRVTRVGRILRRLRIDELPQFINVLRGDLSIVGPRPVRKVFEDQFAQEIPFYSLRHTIKPGLTGWAQTRHDDSRSEKGPLERFQYDLYYIQECSLLLDLLIILKTVQTVLCKPSE